MILNIDLHTHTSRYSPCSVLSPEALCEVAIARGLNALVITEHKVQWSADEIAALQAGYPSLKLYAGVEISCTDRHDYVVIGLVERRLWPSMLSYRHLQTVLDEQPWAFAFVAHCFRHSGQEEGMADRRIDGIEVASYNILAHPQPETGPAKLVRAELYHKWRRRMNWVGLYNSDAHARQMVGTFYNRLQMAALPPDEAALVEVLRQVKVQGIEDADLIRAAINRW
jgi:histidinol phosphatase-like PHP family hydrolase